MSPDNVSNVCIRFKHIIYHYISYVTLISADLRDRRNQLLFTKPENETKIS